MMFTTYALIPGPLLDQNKSWLSYLTNSILLISGPIVNVLNHRQSWLAPFHLWLLPHTKALSTLNAPQKSLLSVERLASRTF
jgi:hypothetical protein